MNLQQRLVSISSEVNEVTEWAESEYNKYFSVYFQKEKELYNRLKSSSDPITDQELEWILTELPLELFSVTEQLSRLKIAQEVIKINIKQFENDFVANSDEGSVTKRKEQASMMTLEDKLLVDIYDSIIDRVNRQMTFSKELIMSAKKIWDTRRADGIPTPEVVTDKEAEVLPDYYIKSTR